MKIALLTAILLANGTSLNAFPTPWSSYLSGLASAVTLWQAQGITGNLTFGCPGGGPIPAFYDRILPMIELVVRPSTGVPINVPLNWTSIESCDAIASFRVGWASGNYSLDVTWCQEGAGCTSIINPVTVESNKFTVVYIDTNTKIR